MHIGNFLIYPLMQKNMIFLRKNGFLFNKAGILRISYSCFCIE
jgi:hypothetical protein